MDKVLEQIQEIGIVPVVVLNDAKDAEPLAKALCDGGLACAEVTFRTAAAEESIRIMSEKFPDMLVGAGTVLTTEQVDRAVAKKCDFGTKCNFSGRCILGFIFFKSLFNTTNPHNHTPSGVKTSKIK